MGSGSAKFDFGGGTIETSAAWSSSLDISLTGLDGLATVDTTGANIGLSGILSGTGGLEKVGAGLLILSGSNSYDGGTIVEAGTLDVTNSDALAEGSTLTVGAGASAFFDSSGIVASPASHR